MDVFEFMEYKGFEINTNYVKLFWNVIDNNDWIYLNDEIIKNYMTNQKGSDAIKQFIRRKILECNDYEENKDYKIIKKNDELVKIYESSVKIIKRKTSNRKKYYAVTGKCFKDLLLKTNTINGNNIRKYYIDLENIYVQYIKYQCEFYKTNYYSK